MSRISRKIFNKCGKFCTYAVSWGRAVKPWDTNLTRYAVENMKCILEQNEAVLSIVKTTSSTPSGIWSSISIIPARTVLLPICDFWHHIQVQVPLQKSGVLVQLKFDVPAHVYCQHHRCQPMYIWHSYERHIHYMFQLDQTVRILKRKRTIEIGDCELRVVRPRFRHSRKRIRKLRNVLLPHPWDQIFHPQIT
jgi:hypothetical protein